MVEAPASATPTPTSVVAVNDISTKTSTDTSALLHEAGYVVPYVLRSSGSTIVADGIIVKSQRMTARSRLDAKFTGMLLAPALEPAAAPTVEPGRGPRPLIRRPSSQLPCGRLRPWLGTQG